MSFHRAWGGSGGLFRPELACPGSVGTPDGGIGSAVFPGANLPPPLLPPQPHSALPLLLPASLTDLPAPMRRGRSHDAGGKAEAFPLALPAEH